MKKIITVFLFAFLSFQNFTSRAQIDTAFWFAVPFSSPDAGPRHDYKLHIYTYGAPSTIVRIRQPAGYIDTTFTMGSYSNFDYTFWFDKLASTINTAFDSLEARPADVILNYGLKITSDNDISTVFDMVTTFNNPETFALKGRRNGSGLEFYCPFQQKGNNQTLGNAANTPPGVIQPKQQINIIAMEPNTTVSITPKCNVVGHLANITYTVLLPFYGHVYTIENASQTTTVLANNLSGSHIVSNKPISVTVADDCVKGLAGCYDMMGDQIVPVNKVGKDYIIVKGDINATENEGVYIVGTVNNTSLTINDGITTNTVIGAGDTYFYKTNQPLTYVNASGDVYAMHVTGVGCEMSSDIVPPLACAGSTVTHITRNNTQSLNLNIYCRNGAQSTFTLNGSTTLIPASAFTVVPGTAALLGGPYYGAKINFNSTLLPIGSYTVANNVDDFGLSICNGGGTSGSFYHYTTLFSKPINISVGNNYSVCANSNSVIALSGTVTGAANIGTWTTPNGTGVFGTYTSTINTISTNYTLSSGDLSNGSIKFYLTSLGSCMPKKDSLQITLTLPPQITITPATSICSTNTNAIALSSTLTNANSGTWNSSGTGVFFPSNSSPSATYSPSTGDLSFPNFTLTYTAFNGCGGTAATAIYTVIPSPTVTATTNVPLLCVGLGLSATLTASGANTYSWSTSSTNTSIVVSPNTQTTYTVTGFANGCSNTSTITQATAICMGVEKNQNANAGLNIYPNPNTGEFVIEANENTQLKLINELGQVVKTISITDKKTVISGLAKGIYFINGNMNGKTINEKIIVQ